jgi:hypothetical protein
MQQETANKLGWPVAVMLRSLRTPFATLELESVTLCRATLQSIHDVVPRREMMDGDAPRRRPWATQNPSSLRCFAKVKARPARDGAQVDCSFLYCVV